VNRHSGALSVKESDHCGPEVEGLSSPLPVWRQVEDGLPFLVDGCCYRCTAVLEAVFAFDCGWSDPLGHILIAEVRLAWLLGSEVRSYQVQASIASA